MTKYQHSRPIANDPMGKLNSFFVIDSEAEKNWKAMKKQISMLVCANQEMERQHGKLKADNQSMQKEYARMKRANEAIKNDVEDLKKEKRGAEEYTNALESKVKALSVDNKELKVQMHAKNEMMHQVESELGVGPDYLLCGAAS
mmetsp:Transcript_29300/g.48431  ORF Transcript_29300/g.48431 Transcript_29300/m.48431 type:complete len:144 (-) Transcript_29300:299-730(-)|eukprot:CAMPEP_0119004868 /NCGR_PEP_ID=MMETSP1176-20130426/1401_1 /TAXON_ID=265551 /ORGANISM="Synedropsis recta cf, Strain CCMP1620" /LENGTH=143 /DNA_ID=CAMNT_0006956623 /DNA_START=102 /DNA_END=533 /DNA_ORIENTATION=+